jgi:serine/threonine protein kinase
MSKPFCPICKEEFEPAIRFCPNDGTGLISAKSADRQDQVFDQRYKLAEKLGEGGMGAVYKAVQMSTGKFVALKVVSASHTQNEDTIRRFQREVKLQTKLSHPNLVSILDFSRTAEGEYYFIMEYVEGKSLSKFIKEKGQLSMRDFMEIASQLCDGLEYAHRQGIIHRDLKGDNVIVTDIGHQLVVKILDFGLAKAVAGENQNITADLTQMGSALGTPAYMSPEQAMGELNRLGPHSDIYTLGVIFYQMLTGQLPFKASTPWGLMQKHISETPAPVRDFNRDTPNAVDKIVMKCLEKDPDARYSSAIGIKRDLEKTTFAMQKEVELSLGDSDHTTLNLKAVRSRFVLKAGLMAALAAAIFIFGLYGGLDKRIAGLFRGQEQAAPPRNPTKKPDQPSLIPPDGGVTAGGARTPDSSHGGAQDSAPIPALGPSQTGSAVVNQPVSDDTYRIVFGEMIAGANKAMETNDLANAGKLLAHAEIIFPTSPELEPAKKTLAVKLEHVAKAISDEIGYIEAIDKKWGFIIISRIKGVKADLGEKVYAIGKDGKTKELVIKKIRPTKLSAVTKEKLALFKEGMKVIRKPPPQG